MSQDAIGRYFERYDARLEACIDRLDAAGRRYSQIRLALFIGGSAAAFVAYQVAGENAPWMVGGLFVVAFMLVANLHARTMRARARTIAWREIKARHLARIRRQWNALPPHGPVSSAPGHDYAVDLNISGPRSLHHLIDCAESDGGSSRLLHWLMATHPDVPAAQTRQACVKELVPMSGFRDRLALLSLEVQSEAEPRWSDEALMVWLKQGRAHEVLPWLIGLSILAAVNSSLLLLYLLAGWPAYWLYGALIYVGLYLHRFRLYKHLFRDSLVLGRMLDHFAAPLTLIQNRRFARQPALARLAEAVQSPGLRPENSLRGLRRIATAAGLSRNDLLRIVLNLVMPWELIWTYAQERFKERLRQVLPSWLSVWYDFEALGSLANYAALHPSATFPTFEIKPGSGAIFIGKGLGHPLLSEHEKVRNDFVVPALGDVSIVTGSNMSGKSTFLRTVGVNLVLAQAGGPVDASLLRTIPFRVFTCMTVSDSVNDGLSFFYAEVKRLRALLDALRSRDEVPLFFMIDEIFRGTNNRERLIGSRASIRAAAGSHGTGLVATHDLELVHLENEIAGLRNFHFREDVVGSHMTFDYQMYPGPCPTTNALKIMRLEGLPVEEHEGPGA
ncbi:MutS family DNA mismatch repair protein [soil metagenome]